MPAGLEMLENKSNTGVSEIMWLLRYHYEYLISVSVCYIISLMSK